MHKQIDPEYVRFYEILSDLERGSKKMLGDAEYKNLFNLVKRAEKIPGDIAEVGVFRGGSAKFLADTSKKQVYLFDTFEGLQKAGEHDNPLQFPEGTYCADFEEVSKYLEEYPNVHIYKGLFPETSDPIKNLTFAFVHLDVDLYDSTLKCLEFFYPRMTKCGIIISHDYTKIPAVKKAFDDFFKDKPEIVLPPYGSISQCVVIKS